MDGISRPGATIDRKRELTVAIQAGGESRRVGRDKSLLEFSGKPLIKRIIERFAGLAQEIIITTHDPEKLSFLDLPLYMDIIPGKGALGGLYTSLQKASRPIVAVVACDMPFASPDLVATEVELLTRSGMDVVIPRGPDGLEPLHAVYRRDSCLPAVRRALEGGERRLISWFPQVSVYRMSLDETELHDPDFRAFININTLEDLHRAESMAESGCD